MKQITISLFCLFMFGFSAQHECEAKKKSPSKSSKTYHLLLRSKKTKGPSFTVPHCKTNCTGILQKVLRHHITCGIKPGVFLCYWGHNVTCKCKKFCVFEGCTKP